MHTNSNSDEIASLLEKGCTAWRQGDDQSGIDLFQQACLLWLDQLEQQIQSESSSAAENFSSLIPPMKYLMDRLYDQDTIRAADIIEYEILSLMKSKTSGEIEGGVTIE